MFENVKQGKQVTTSSDKHTTSYYEAIPSKAMDIANNFDSHDIVLPAQSV
jgi:hypothetical protein